MKTFKINNLEFEYCTPLYNDGFGDERRVEIPIGIWAASVLLARGPMIEVGDVLFHYTGDSSNYEVIDLYEKPRPGLLNMDFADYDCKGKNLLSISTFQRMGIVEFKRVNGSKVDLLMSQKMLERVFKDCPYYFITLPRRYRPELDEFIKNVDVPKTLMNQYTDGSWIQDDWDTYERGFYSGISYNISILTNIEEFWNLG